MIVPLSIALVRRGPRSAQIYRIAPFNDLRATPMILNITSIEQCEMRLATLSTSYFVEPADITIGQIQAF